jgi:hypothetical protein
MGWFFLVFIVIFVVVCYWLVGTAPKGSPSPRFVSKARPKTDAVEDSPSEITPAPSPPEDEGKNIGCYVVIVILLAILAVFVAVAYAAISAVGEALDSFFGGVEDFFNVFENVFKGG